MNLPENSSKRTSSLAIVIVLFFAAIVTATARISLAATTNSGIVVPLYTYPTDGSWTTVINTHKSYPGVPIMVIADVSGSGAGSSSDSNYANGIRNMQAAGIQVLGYVDTLYAGRSISAGKTEATNWWNWYKVNGIFFDEMANSGGSESYYSTLTAFAKSLGMTYTMGNPGTTISTSYIGTVDSIVFYESPGLPTLSSLSSYISGYSKSNFGYIAFSVSSLNTSFEVSSSNYVQWLYITNAGGGNPYDVLPSYFATEVAALGPGTTTTTSTTTTTGSTTSGATASLSISTVNTNNQAMTGLYIESVVDNTAGSTVASGLYTTQTLTLTLGHSYSVTVDDYGGNFVVGANLGTFARTSANGGGGTSTFTLQGNTNVAFTLSTSTTSSTTTTTTASTSTTTSPSSATSTTNSTTTSTPAIPTATITAISVDLTGKQFSGVWTTVNSSGVTLATGFTPLTFTGAVGLQYLVTVTNWQSIIFVHWDDGSTNLKRTLSPIQDTILTAYYSVPGDPLTVTLESVSMTGTPLIGMWMQVSSGGGLVASGFTPSSFNATYGMNYTVSATNWRHYVFDHWDDGTTNASEPLTVNGPTTLTAYYRTPVTVTIRSVNPYGQAFSGMWTVVWFGGSIYRTGNTTLTFTATWGLPYTVYVANYQNYVFLHWGSGNGNTNPYRTVTPTENTVIVAVYSTS